METFDCKVSLKLLVDTNSQRVLLAEAGKDFVDFLFTLMCLPLGTVVKLVSKNEMVVSTAALKTWVILICSLNLTRIPCSNQKHFT